MYRIGEFSKMARVSPRMLRYYEKNGLLVPAQTDRFTGYRLYSAAQLKLLNDITALRDMGFSVEEIAGVLPHMEDSAFLLRALRDKRAQVEKDIALQVHKLHRIAAVSGAIEKEYMDMIYEVEIKALPAVKVLALRETVRSFAEEYGMWERLAAFAQVNGVECGEGGYSIYYDEEYKEEDVDIEIAVPVVRAGGAVAPFAYRELAAVPLAATVRFAGSYENYGPAMETLAASLEAQGYRMAGLVRGHAIRMGQDVENNLTELQVPVKRV